MSTVLKQENLTQAKEAISAYRAECESIFQSMRADIESLTSQNFVGDGSNGYNTFFTNITPSLTTNLTGTEGSVTSLLEQVLTAAEQMLNPVDPQIGTANSNAAQIQ